MKTNTKNPFLAAMKSNPLNRFRSARTGALTTFLLLPMALPVSAADRIWDGGGADNNWTTADNWDGTTPVATDRLIFAGSTKLATNNNDIDDTTIGFVGVRFDAGAGAFTLSGNRIRLSTGTIDFSADPAAPITQTINNAIGVVGGDLTVTTQTNGNILLGGVIGDFSTNGRALIKTGTGTLTLNGANEFGGQMRIDHGIVNANTIADTGTPSSLGDGAATNAPNPTIRIGNGSLTGTLVYTGAAAASTNRQIRVGNGNTSGSTGGAIINNNNADAAHTLTFSNTTFINAGMSTTADRTLTLGGTNTGLNTISGAIVNNTAGADISLTKADAGTWVLSGANTFTGTVVIGNGVLSANTLANAGTASSIGAGTASNVPTQFGSGSTAGTLRYTGGTTSTDRRIKIGSDIATDTGGAVIENNGSGALTLSNAFNSAIADVSVTRNLTLTGTNTDANTISGNIRNNATSTGGLVSLTKDGVGTWVLGGVNTFTGAVTINGGTLRYGVSNTMNQASGVTINNTGAGTATLDLNNLGGLAKTLTLGGNSGTVAAVTTGGGTLTLDGNVTYDATNNPNGATISGNVQLSATRTFTIGDSSAAAVDLAISAPIGGVPGAGLIKDGSGVMSLSGPNTYPDATTITAGTLTLGASGVIPDASAVSIGAATLNAATTGTETAGTLDVTGAATINLGTGAVLSFTNSSGVDWTGGTLDITGAFVSGSSIFFGVGGLDGTQLGLITLNGVPTTFTLNGSGFLATGAVSGYAAWQAANSTTQAANLDHDNDGVLNGIEHFLFGTADSTGNSNPLPGVDVGPLSVTWTKAGTYSGTYGTDYVVETSATLSDPWTTEIADPNLGFTVTFPSANEVKYTFPAGTKNFARLKVVAP